MLKCIENDGAFATTGNPQVVLQTQLRDRLKKKEEEAICTVLADVNVGVV